MYISKRLIYIFRDNGTRSYWVFKNLPKSKRPKIKFDDDECKVTLAKNKAYFKKSDYKLVKKYLRDY
jgi:hypothetical protein